MISKLEIKTALRETKTYLKTCFFTTPFKIANVTEDKSEHHLKLMLMTSSPGILDGDQYEIKIELNEGCSLDLQTQSYQRLFNMKEGASQTMEILMEENSSFSFLPHPTVPHRSSVFKTRNQIFLSKNCKLIWGEILTCGRKLSGESFTFSRYHSLTEIFLDGRLVIKENLLIVPSTINLDAIGQYEGFTHQANLLCLDEGMNLSDSIQQLHDILSKIEDVIFGVSSLPVKGIIVRILGYKAEQLHEILKQVSKLFNCEKASNISKSKENYAN